MRRKHICIVATVPHAIKVFMQAHVKALSAEYDVTLVTNGSVNEMTELLNKHVAFVPLQIERKIFFKKDICSLIMLWKLFRKKRFDSVYSITPKAGLLAMLAAMLAGVPLRVHMFTGQVWATKKGVSRFILRLLDKILALCATHVFADSQSQRMFLVENSVVRAQKINVLAEGSVAGVDIERFRYEDYSRCQIRQNHQIPDRAIVYLFVGRLTRDKGVVDLAEAFTLLAEKNENIHLLVVGSDEENLGSIFSSLSQRFVGRVHRVGFVDRPEQYMCAADVFCLPSYREGFGMVIIEAASVGLPAIASRIYGITDAIQDGVTGILHCPASVQEIADAMLFFASNEDARRKMGAAACARVIGKFSQKSVTNAMLVFYHDKFLSKWN